MERFMQERASLVKKMEEFNIEHRKKEAEAQKRDFEFDRTKGEMERKMVEIEREVEKLKKVNGQQKK